MADSKKRDSRGLYLGEAVLWQVSPAVPYGVDSPPLHPSRYLLEMTADSQSPYRFHIFRLLFMTTRPQCAEVRYEGLPNFGISQYEGKARFSCYNSVE